jgi:sugar phosphate isomerase/epimerase
MKACISQALTMPRPFAEDVNDYPSAGCQALEVWLTKLEEHLQSHTVADTRKLLSDRGLQLTAASCQGGLILSQGESRKAHQDHYKRRLDLCQEFGIRTLVVLPDPIERPQMSDINRAVASLAEAAQWADAFQVRLALEFQGHNRFCASLDTAVGLVAATGEPNCGIALDLFHYYTGPSKFEDLGLLTPENLFHVQICDLAGVMREMATDSDRVFPGEGDFHLEPILTQLQRIGYDGWVSLEILNPTLWQMKATQVVELGNMAMNRLLGSGPSAV